MKARILPFILSFVFIFLASKILTGSEYILCTADKSGVYYKLGILIEEVAENADPPIYIKLKDTKGSLQNLEYIEEDAHFALVQGDIIESKYSEYFNDNKFDIDALPIRILCSLYTEKIQICVRSKLKITELRELEGKRVFLGEDGSGTERNARSVLGSLGISISEVDKYEKGIDDRIDLLLSNEDGKIDAAFFTAGAPHPVIKKLLEKENDGAYLLNLDVFTIKILTENNRATFLSKITRGTYPGMKENVNTVGVSACLVCSKERVPSNVVQNLLAAIYKDKKKFSSLGIDELITLRKRDGLKGISREILHDEAKDFFKEAHAFMARDLFDLYDKYWQLGLLVILAIVFFLLRRKISKFLKEKKFIRYFIYNFGIVFVLIFVILLPSGIALFFMEHHINESFSTPFKSIGSIILFLCGGFSDCVPVTPLGRLVSLVGIIGAIIIGSFFTGVIAAMRVRGLMMHKGKPGREFKNHVVILGWNEKGKGAVETLIDWKKSVVVLCEEDKSKIEEAIERKEKDHKLVIRSGSPSAEENLKNLKLDKADSVLVLATKSGKHLEDDLTVIIILQVRKLFDAEEKKLEQKHLEEKKKLAQKRFRKVAKKHRQKHFEEKKKLAQKHLVEKRKVRPHIVAEVLNPDMKRAIFVAGADEVVCTSDLGKNLLANCTVTAGFSKVFEDLLKKDPNTNEFYLENVPPYFYENSYTYKKFCSWLLENCECKSPIVPLGIKKVDNEIEVNPRNPNMKLQEGDKVLLMAFDESCLKFLRNQEQMKKK